VTNDAVKLEPRVNAINVLCFIQNKYIRYIYNIFSMGELCLNSKYVKLTTLGALMIVSGVHIKMMTKFYDKEQQSYLGMASFLLGWVIIALATSKGRKSKMNLLSCISVVMGVMLIMKSREDKTETKLGPILFMVGWVSLGLGVVQHKKGMMYKLLGLLIPTMVLLSMVPNGIIPKQREEKMVDGPGYSLFVGGWALLIFLNSLNRH